MLLPSLPSHHRRHRAVPRFTRVRAASSTSVATSMPLCQPPLGSAPCPRSAGPTPALALPPGVEEVWEALPGYCVPSRGRATFQLPCTASQLVGMAGEEDVVGRGGGGGRCCSSILIGHKIGGATLVGLVGEGDWL